MSKKSITVVKKNDPGWGKGVQQGAPPQKKGPVPSPTKSNAHVIQLPSSKKKKKKKQNNGNNGSSNTGGGGKQLNTVKKPFVPKPPPDPTLAPNLAPWQDQLSYAGDLLGRSEGRSGVDGVTGKWGAHARKEHVGRKGDELESRGKFKDGAYLNEYEQNKSMAMALATQHGQSVWGKSGHANGEFSSFAQPKLTPWMTQPIVRNAQKIGQDENGKPIYDHYNAKVNEASGKFTQDTGMNEGRRVQTLFGTGVERLPKPLPGGQLPTSKVSLSGINEGNLQDLRPTTTQVKGSMASDTFGSNEEVLPSTQDGITARPALGKVTGPPEVHQPVGESTNAPSPTPITTDEGSSVSSDTEGGGNLVGGEPSEGVSTDKKVESGGEATPKLSKGQRKRRNKKLKKQMEEANTSSPPVNQTTPKPGKKWKTVGKK